MIERGMSAAEIDQVIRSRPDDASLHRRFCGFRFGHRSLI
jgi:hypothetical protein